ncbi:MAG TPA: hypothetical protein V6D37_00220 [Candidatus Sericytochromatia bacterium]|jgi:hypothetical protein
MRFYSSIILLILATISLSANFQLLTKGITTQISSISSERLMAATQTEQEGYKRPRPASPPRPIY